MNKIVIENDKYLFKKEIYDDSELEILIKKLHNNTSVIISGENLLVKVFEDSIYNSRVAIEKTISGNLIFDEDTLVDYHYDKKSKCLYAYSIKQGERVYKLLKKIKNVKVEPIQYLIKRVVQDKLKYKGSYKILVEINDYIYFLHVKDKMIRSATVSEKIEDIISSLSNEDGEGHYLIDKSLSKSMDKNDLVSQALFIDIKEKVENEIY